MFMLHVKKTGNQYVEFDRVRFDCPNCHTGIVSLFKNGRLMNMPFVRKTCGCCMKPIPDIEGCFLRTSARIKYLKEGE